jgi:Icc-related predicted phosphoesterase
LHGRVFHALGVVVRWQQESGKQLDLIVQVGDLGAWPDPARADEATKRFAQSDPGEFDFSRLLHLGEAERRALVALRQRLSTPVLFIAGNHEDEAWLEQLETGHTPPILVDPVGLYQYVPDGTVLDVQACTIGFAGGEDISDEAYDGLVALGEGLDILVTHDAPRGVSRGWSGDVQGSERLLRLIETMRPRYHVFGHLHRTIGPVQVANTTCVGLAQLVASVPSNPSQIINPGSLGVLDTVRNEFHLVQDEWLAEFSRQANILDLAVGFCPSGRARLAAFLGQD